MTGEPISLHVAQHMSDTANALIIGIVVLLIASASYFYYVALSFKPSRIYLHSLCMGICALTAIFYTIVIVGGGRFYPRNGESKPYFWTRYLDWLITSSMILTVVMTIAGSPTGQTTNLVIFNLLSGLCFACGAYYHSWTLWTFSVVTMMPVLRAFFGGLSRQAAMAPSDVRHCLRILCLVSGFLWMAYVLGWVPTHGINSFGMDGEVIYYALVDLLGKGGFCWIVCPRQNKEVIDKTCLRDETS